MIPTRHPPEAETTRLAAGGIDQQRKDTARQGTRLGRLDAWMEKRPMTKTRRSRFAALAQAALRE